MFQLPRILRFSLTAVTALIAACGGGDGAAPPTAVPAAFTLSLSSTTLSIEQGGSGSVTATIGRTGNFTATVNLTAESLPTGITASFDPSAITSSTTTTTLSVTVAASVSPGSHSFTVRGQAGSGGDQKTATVTLTVTAKPAIAITLSAGSASVQQGANTSYTATLARTNYTGAATVAVTGAPGGTTTAVTNAGDVFTITVTVGGATAPGTYTLTTMASGTGVTTVNATFSLTVTAAPPSIQLAATPAAVSVSAGGAGQASVIAITRINFTGTVVVAVQSGLPAGATASISPTGPTLATSSTVAFLAAVSTVPGTYNVVLQGAGFQAAAGTVQIALTVTAQSSSIVLSTSPAALSVQQGASGNTTINIARTNFTGAVTLAASGQPNGVTPTFTTSPTAGNSATLTLAVGASVATGTHVITVTGSGTGIGNVTATVSLTITQPSAGGNVSFSFCGAARNLPIWFAAQSGTSGAWTAVAAGANNTYSTNISGFGAVAWVLQNNTNDYTLTLAYGTPAELSSQGTSYCASPTLKTVTGTVTGFGATNSDFALVAFGIAFASPPPTAALPNFTITGAPDGVRDLVATRSTLNINNPIAPLTLNKIFIKRGLNPPNFGSVGTVDFNGSDAFDPETKQVTINGIAGGESVFASNTFITNTQSFGALGSVTLTTGSTLNVPTVPAAKTIAGDVQAFAITAAITSGPTSQMRSVTAAFRDPANQTVTLGAPLNAPTVTLLTTAPYVRLRSELMRQSDYQNYWTASYSQGTTAVRRAANITMTEGYIGGAASFDVTVPDFTGVGGWQNMWGLQSGASTAWNVTAFGWLTGSGGLMDGTVYRVGQRQGTLTP